jgi:acetylornithine deacetylase/succinyl-diaminopimelate desuccinylase-like protein
VLERIVEVTTDLVAIPTYETEGAAQAYLAEVLEAAGFDCTLQEIAPDRPNLFARRSGGGTFVCSHIDTHPPHGHPEPFACRRRGEVLLGRGVLDAKGQIAALVAAVEADPDAPVTIAITCDEEYGGLGSEGLEIGKGPWHTEGGIVLEPTGFRVCVAQGGHIDLRLEASANATHTYAHTGQPTPIDIVLDSVEALHRLPLLETRHPLLPPPRVHLGTIRGGEHLWRTPARASAEVAIGLVPGIGEDEARAQVRDAIESVARTWNVEGASLLYDIVDASAAIEIPPDLPIVQRLRSVLKPHAQLAGMPSWTDAANLLQRHDVPCVIFGAGELETAHSNLEWVTTDDLVRLASTLVDVFRTDGTAR